MPAADKRPLKVFLCHAHADRNAVRALYTRLTKDGVDAWLDKEKLLPGQDWDLEIRKAVREADVVVVCLSKQFNQAGFRQKEVRLALDTAMEQPEGDIFIIPARLEECDSLESLRKWHWVDLFEDDGYEMLMRALRARADKIGATFENVDHKKTERETTEKVAHDKAEKDAVEKSRLEAEEQERQKKAKEKADREAAEKIIPEKAKKEDAKKAQIEVEERAKQKIQETSNENNSVAQNINPVAIRQFEEQKPIIVQDSGKQSNLKFFVLIFAAIVINVFAGQIATIFNFPINFDSIGTILISILLGPWLGALAGLISAMVNGALAGTNMGWLAGASVGIVTGYLANTGFFKDWWKVIMAGFAISFTYSLTYSFTYYVYLGFDDLSLISNYPFVSDILGNVFSAIIVFFVMRMFLKPILENFPHLNNVLMKK